MNQPYDGSGQYPQGPYGPQGQPYPQQPQYPQQVAIPGYHTFRVDTKAPAVAASDCVPPRLLDTFTEPVPVSYCLTKIG